MKIKKLIFKKETIMNLNNVEMKEVNGGFTSPCSQIYGSCGDPSQCPITGCCQDTIFPTKQ